MLYGEADHMYLYTWNIVKLVQCSLRTNPAMRNKCGNHLPSQAKDASASRTFNLCMIAKAARHSCPGVVTGRDVMQTRQYQCKADGRDVDVMVEGVFQVLVTATSWPPQYYT